MMDELISDYTQAVFKRHQKDKAARQYQTQVEQALIDNVAQLAALPEQKAFKRAAKSLGKVKYSLQARIQKDDVVWQRAKNLKLVAQNQFANVTALALDVTDSVVVVTSHDQPFVEVRQYQRVINTATLLKTIQQGGEVGLTMGKTPFVDRLPFRQPKNRIEIALPKAFAATLTGYLRDSVLRFNEVSLEDITALTLQDGLLDMQKVQAKEMALAGDFVLRAEDVIIDRLKVDAKEALLYAQSIQAAYDVTIQKGFVQLLDAQGQGSLYVKQGDIDTEWRAVTDQLAITSHVGLTTVQLPLDRKLAVTTKSRKGFVHTDYHDMKGDPEVRVASELGTIYVK
jgi:antitoxin (DNA-binding transcriptional repressor) of toxin-antitoxin stability system